MSIFETGFSIVLVGEKAALTIPRGSPQPAALRFPGATVTYDPEAILLPDGSRVAGAVISVGSESAEFARLSAKVIVTAADSPYDVKATDRLIVADSTDGDVILNLPPSSTGARDYLIKAIAPGGGVTVNAGTDELIDGSAFRTMESQYDGLHLERSVGHGYFLF